MHEFVSVVIPTYNRLDTLKLVLNSLLFQDYNSDLYEVLVCDSLSTDGTKQHIEGLNNEKIRYLLSDVKTRSVARNTGIRYARGDIILFTDADIIADKSLIREHVRQHILQRNIAVVGCEIQADTLAEIEKVMKDPSSRRTLHPDKRKKVGWLYFLTGNASVRRADLVKAGGFDQNFTGYGHEDIELGYRLYKCGIDILYNYKAVNYHLHPVGFDEQCAKMRQAGGATVKFYNKYKDPAIKFKLGMTPASLFLHSLISKDGWFMRFCRKRVDKVKLCKEIVLQHCYIDGIKEAMMKGFF